MLDQLVESKSNRAENKTRGGYLLTTFVLVVGLLFSAVLWSLFAKDLGMGREEFELSSLITPVPISDNAPAPMPKEPKREQAQNPKPELLTRQANTLRIDESPIAPAEISVKPNTQKSRPNGYFLLKDGIENAEPSAFASTSRGREGKVGGVGISNSQASRTETIEKSIPPPPPIKKLVAETIEKRKAVVSGGVVNGQATSLPKPPYPLAAKAVHAEGNVSVQVMIDETGNVISAKAIEGNSLLKPAAEKAALSAKFKPTLLTGQPVKVTGIIVYKFVTQ